jgi:glycosyltransferase involved in cell wall biosynthesis
MLFLEQEPDLRLLCFTQFYPPSVGGMQLSNKLLVEGLVAAGINVELHVFSDSASSTTQEKNFNRYDYAGSPKSVVEHLSCARTIDRQAKISRPDFVLLLDEGMVRALGFLPFVKKNRLRYISINSGSTLTRGARHFRGRVNASLVRRGYRWLDLLFVAQSTAVALPDVCPAVSEKIRIIGRPIPDSFFRETYSADSIKLFDNNLPVLFSCARAEEEKGIGLVLQALARLRDDRGTEICNFLFTGDGPALEGWRHIAQKSSLINVSFIGRRPLEDLLPYYHSCYMCIFPAHGTIETFGRTWMEAFACGKPVISTDTDNLKYLVSDGVNAIVIRPSVDSICNGIQRALNLSLNEYSEMVHRARETACSYKQSTIVGSLLNTLRELDE